MGTGIPNVGVPNLFGGVHKCGEFGKVPSDQIFSKRTLTHRSLRSKDWRLLPVPTARNHALPVLQATKGKARIKTTKMYLTRLPYARLHCLSRDTRSLYKTYGVGPWHFSGNRVNRDLRLPE